jgi:hypothetical protein
LAEDPVAPGKKTRFRTLDDLDQRTTAAKKARELMRAMTVDLGGDDHLTAAQRELVQRACLLSAFLADCEANWLAGQPVHAGDWFAAIDRQTKVLLALGLQRRAKPVMDLRQYLAQKERA